MASSRTPAPDVEAATLFRLLVDGVRDYAIVMLDRQGNVTGWNPGAERIKGYTAGEILGEHFSCFYTAEDIAGGLPGRVLWTAETTGRYRGEGWRVRKDGTRFWASLVVTPLVDDDGELRGFGKLVRDVTERREAEFERERLVKALEESARTDDLTGLLNRRVWREQFELELARAARYSTSMTLAVLDLDGFKAVNDEQGHLKGDEVLREVSVAWRGLLRSNDIISRYGGDEFVCLLPSCTEQEAGVTVKRMLEVNPTGISVSAGVAAWDRRETGEELFARADRALYRAKDEAGNRVVLAREPVFGGSS